MRRRRSALPVLERSAFAGFRFPPEAITVAVRWYLRYALSYRDVQELLAERGIEADHVTVYRWVQRFTSLFGDAARPLRHVTGDRWFVDETYIKVTGRWRYLYRAVDQYGQVIDVLLSEQRHTAAARQFFTRALRHGRAPAEVPHGQGRPDSAGPRRTGLGRSAHHRAVRQQPRRSRSRPVEGPAPADAGTQTRPLRRSDRRRPRVRAEPSPRPLRTRRRRPGTRATPGGLRRACSRRATGLPPGSNLSPAPPNATPPFTPTASSAWRSMPTGGSSTTPAIAPSARTHRGRKRPQ